MTSRLFLRLILSALLLLNASIAYAGVSVSPYNQSGPSVFNFDNVEPGESYTKQISIVNNGSTLVSIELRGLDAYIGGDGSYYLKKGTAEQFAKWINFEEVAFDLEPHGSRLVAFDVDFPLSLPPGDYAGGMLAEVQESVRGEGAIQTTSAIGLRLFASIAGELISSLDWLDYNYIFDKENENYTFNYSFENTGNTMLRLDGELSLTNKLWGAPEKFDASITQLSPRTGVVEKSITWENPPVIGIMEATTNVSYEQVDMWGKLIELPNPESRASSRTITFYIIPVIELLVAAALSLLIFLWLMHRDKKKKAQADQQQAYYPQQQAQAGQQQAYYPQQQAYYPQQQTQAGQQQTYYPQQQTQAGQQPPNYPAQ